MWVMHLSFEISFDYEGEEIAANATPSQFNDTVVYDVNFQETIISIEPQPSEELKIIWVQHLTGETNDLIQAIGQAIERAEM